jgi:hypothetical protein
VIGFHFVAHFNLYFHFFSAWSRTLWTCWARVHLACAHVRQFGAGG